MRECAILDIFVIRPPWHVDDEATATRVDRARTNCTLILHLFPPRRQFISPLAYKISCGRGGRNTRRFITRSMAKARTIVDASRLDFSGVCSNINKQSTVSQLYRPFLPNTTTLMKQARCRTAITRNKNCDDHGPPFSQTNECL